MSMIGKIFKYGRLTLAYPKKPMDSKFFAASPAIDLAKCTRCGECVRQCPTQAIVMPSAQPIGINFDECIFCARCADVCPTGAASMTQNFELAQLSRENLRTSALVIDEACIPAEPPEATGKLLQERIHKLFGRSLQIREVDAGSCNGCDYEINALNNPFNDIERFGIHFVASPRHADQRLYNHHRYP